VPERDAVALDHLDERVDDDRVELVPPTRRSSASASSELTGIAVRVARGHDVVGVGGGEDARAERDVLAAEAVGIAAPSIRS
jgi:hypothetical protein